MAALSVRATASWNPQIGITSHVALVVTVNRGNGDPVTGLQASNFHVFDAGGHGGIEDSRAIAPFESFHPHQAGGAQGAYTIGLGGGFVGQMPIIVVDVTAGADRGRAMTQVRFR
jgi:hypothetical protein